MSQRLLTQSVEGRTW